MGGNPALLLGAREAVIRSSELKSSIGCTCFAPAQIPSPGTCDNSSCYYSFSAARTPRYFVERAAGLAGAVAFAFALRADAAPYDGPRARVAQNRPGETAAARSLSLDIKSVPTTWAQHAHIRLCDQSRSMDFSQW